MATESLRARSKRDYQTDNSSLEHLRTGAILRIADATERMASNYINLQDDRDRYSKWYYEEQERRQGLERSNSSLRGQITKLKKALAATKGVVTVDVVPNV